MVRKIAVYLQSRALFVRERALYFCTRAVYFRQTTSYLSKRDLYLHEEPLRVEFLLKTDGGYPRDVEVSVFTLANVGSSLRFNTHWSTPPVSALARSGKMSQSPVSRNSNIERRMDRPKAVVGVIRGVA